MTSEVMDLMLPWPENIAMHADSIQQKPHRPFAQAGALIREWRIARRLSQLELAFNADISPRHLSYIETGRSQPGREVVARLAMALGMPLREHNTLLVAAGHAPEYHETSLVTTVMRPVRQAIEFIIQQQEPYPALVMNRHWEVLMVNNALERMSARLRGGPPKHSNVLRQVFDPTDMRPFILNWEEVAGDLIRHLHNEVAAAPTDSRARELLDEMLSYPDVPAHWHIRDVAAVPQPLLTTVFGAQDLELHFFSAFTTFGTPRDVTLDELRIECMFPADDTTAELCRQLAGNGDFGTKV